MDAGVLRIGVEERRRMRKADVEATRGMGKLGLDADLDRMCEGTETLSGIVAVEDDMAGDG